MYIIIHRHSKRDREEMTFSVNLHIKRIVQPARKYNGASLLKGNFFLSLYKITLYVINVKLLSLSLTIA